MNRPGILSRSPVLIFPFALLIFAALAACRADRPAEPTSAPEAAAKTAAPGAPVLTGAARRPVRRGDAYFGVHFDLHPNAQDTVLGVDVSEEMVSAVLDRVSPDYVQYDCK